MKRIWIVALCWGCSSSPTTNDDPVTYSETVAPLMARHCVACHREGGIGTMALDDYESVAASAPAVVDAIATRRMPPHPADASGACGEFEDPRWLTDEEIATVERWVAGGTRRGPAMPPPEARPLPALPGEVLAVDIGADYQPVQGQSDDYRCFIVDSPGDVAVTGFDVLPGNPRIVHHLLAYQAVDDAAAAQARARDEADEGPGYDCLGTGPGVDAVSVAGWAPGQGATVFPDGLGIELTADQPLILELHYNIAGGPGESDRTALELAVTTSGSVRPIAEVALWDADFSAPPGMASFSTSEDHRVSWQLEGWEGSVQLLAANAHMHQRGVSQRLERVTDAGTECLLDVPRWDFDWQQTYWYAEPVAILGSDTLRITCEFDTRGATGNVTWGEGTADEMCLASFLVLAE